MNAPIEQSFNYSKTVRPELTLAFIAAFTELVDACGDVEPVILEYKKKFDLILMKEDAGILTGTGIKKPRPPRKNSLAGLGFSGAPTGTNYNAASNPLSEDEQLAAINKQWQASFDAAPVYNAKQLAWMAYDNGNLRSIADTDHLHTPDSKYEWANDTHKGRIPPGKTRWNPDLDCYE